MTIHAPPSSQTLRQVAVLAPAREPAAGGASNANRPGCGELSELGELRAARSQLRFLEVGGSAWSQGAQHRRHVAARESPRWFSLPQSSRSGAVRGVCVFSLAGGCRSRRRFSSLDPAPSTSAHVYCDAPSIKTDVRQRRAGGAGSWAAVGRGDSAASATSRARAGLLQSRRCSRVAVAAANDKGECARWWCVCVAPPATGHWPAPLPWLAYKGASAAARLRPPPFPQCHAPRHCCITRESLHQRCITCIKPASPASNLHHLHQACIT